MDTLHDQLMQDTNVLGQRLDSRDQPKSTEPLVLDHVRLASIGRAEYPCVNDAEVISAFQVMSRSEGIIPALECAHPMAWIIREAPKMQGQTILMNLSGRGDKDVAQMMEILDGQL